MASEVKANKISPATGTDVTLGDASDTFTIPASATLDVNGIIDLTGATKTGFPASGGFAGVDATTATGSTTYTVPTDITKLLVFITGAGGGGGGATVGVDSGFGGSSGSTVIARVTVVAADTITIVIGAGGTAGGAGAGGGIGGSSTFTHASGSGSGSMSTITSPGGPAGTYVGSVIIPLAPTAGTVGANNEGLSVIGEWGGRGALRTGANSFWGSGGMGAAPANGTAKPGVVFGSGGGAGTINSGYDAGAAGANGVCFIMEFK